jgi:hypothetical protein
MSDWADDFIQNAKLSFPRLVPEIDSLCSTEWAIDLLCDLLLDQHPNTFQC